MNDENLIPLSKRSPRDRKRISKMGNDAFRAKCKRTGEIKEAINVLLKMEIPGSDKTGAEALASKLFQLVLKKDDVSAFKALMEYSGQKPTDKLEITSVDKTISDLQNYIKGKKNGKKSK